MTRARPRAQRLAAAAALVLGATLALGAATAPPAPPADTPPPSPPPAQPPAEPAPPKDQPTSPPPSGLPDLDELLGLPRPGAGDARGGIEDPSKADLNRRLSGAEIGDMFKQAVGLMEQAAQRLGAEDAQRAGIGTQRIQEDAVRKLDQLIAQLEQMANQNSQSKSSSSSPQQQSRSQPQPQQARADQQNQGENVSENEPPARQDGPLRPELDSTRASWGALPERVRDMLLQGSSDRFSSMYEKMTESYYRRLAEERSAPK